ncbi:MAG: autotransporter-associated beta strand repeat-containing protein [Verrucomicrobia bacterium]|nr:autotransporter-associated beta strand repeat-containing protein [Verrucomicrobiota bacterium]
MKAKSILPFIVAGLAPLASAANITWDGGGDATTLELNTNWTGDVLPNVATPDTAVFDGTAAGSLSLVYAAGLGGVAGNTGINLNLTATQTGSVSIDSATNTALRINNVTLDAGSGAFALGNGTGSGATAFAITLGGAVNQTHVWSNNSTAAATVGSDVLFGLGGGGDHALNITGSGNWSVGNALQVAAGQFALMKTGTGELSLSGGGNLNNAGLALFGAVQCAALKEGTTRITAGTYTCNSKEFTVGGLDTGAGTNTQLIMDGGALTAVNWLSIGKGNGNGTATSALVLNNAATVSSANISMGWMQTNTVGPKVSATLNGTSSITLTGTAHIAESNASSATLTLNDGSSFSMTGTPGSDNQRNLGLGGAATININGTATFTDASTRFLSLGRDNGTGTINMTGGTFNKSAGELRVGTTGTNGAYTATGTFYMSGGTANAGALTVGRGNNNQALVNGTVTVNGGTFNAGASGDVIIGYAGAGNTGTLNISGGTFNAGTTATRWFHVGYWDTTKGVVNISNGNLNLNRNTSIKFNRGTGTGANVITQSGGNVTFFSDLATTVGGTGNLDMMYGGAAASNTTYHLDGGTLAVPQIISTTNNGTRTFNFNGGTLKATGNQAAFMSLGTGSAFANLRNGGAVIDTNGFDVTIAQPLQHSNVAGDNAIDGGLSKQGNGKLTLSSAATYTGATTVNGGTLALGAAASINTSAAIAINGTGAKLLQTSGTAITPTVTLTSGAVDGTGGIDTLIVADAASNAISAGNGGIGTLSVGTLTFGGAAMLNVRTNATGVDQSIDALTLSTSGTSPITINATNSSGFWTSGTDYPVLTYGTYGVADASHFALGPVPNLNPNQSAELVNTGTAIAIRVTGESLVWTGGVNSDWTTTPIGGAKNWNYQGSGIEFSTNSPVIFDDSASLFTVNLAENVSPSAVVFSNSGNDYTLSSTGGFGLATGGIILNGTAKVTIATNNTSTGAITINDGTLEVTGSVAASSQISNSSSLILNPVVAQTYPNPISGAGGIEKAGGAALTLSGANTFTGNFTLTSGTLNLNSAGALGAAPGTFVLNGGTLDNTSGVEVVMTGNKPQTWNADVTFTGTNSLNMGNGAVALAASRTVNVLANKLYVGAIGDAAAGYGLTKTGNGTLVVNGGNIGGNLDVQNGIVGTNQDFLGAAPVGTGILENAGNVGTKWTFWYGPSDVTSNLLIRNNDGTHTRQLGIVKRGSGTLTLTNPSNNATANLAVDSGKLVVSAGTYGGGNDDGSTNTGLTSIIGNTAGANAVLEINGATVNYNNRSAAGTDAWRSTLDIGSNATGAGALKLNSGSLSTNMQLGIGRNGAYGGMVQTDGTTTVGGFLALGLNASPAVLNLAGGTFNQLGPVTSGAGAGSVGVISLSGTASYNQTSVGDLGLWLGENGTGILNLSGSASVSIVAGNNGVQLGRLASGNGIANLLGGTLTTKAVAKGAGTGTLNFNGGKLAANTANTAFVAGLNHAYVYPGGGTIDNGGNAVTIAQALEAPTGNGVSASGLTVSGGGYIAPPVVTIGGDGTGATAVAEIDPSGNLTGITITNPGVDYMNITVSLSGGGVGNTGSVSGSASFVANTSGGVSYSGAGTTTLTGVNTYTGNSTVSSGTTLVLADNAGLKFVPGANGVCNKLTGAGSAFLYGDFTIDLSGAALANGNSWTLVDTSSRNFDPLLFTVNGFTEVSQGVHQLVDGANTWTFSESTGALTLAVAAPSGYAAWAGMKGLTAGVNDGPSQDPDADGLNNLLEFVLDGDPLANSAAVAPSVTRSGSNLILTFKRRDDSEAEVAVKVETSPNLGTGTWNTYATIGATSGANYTVAENAADPDLITVTIPITGDKAFYRVSSTKP